MCKRWTFRIPLAEKGVGAVLANAPLGDISLSLISSRLNRYRFILWPWPSDFFIHPICADIYTNILKR